MLVQTGYALPIVLLSVVVGIFASFTALDLSGRVQEAEGAARRAWLVAAALGMGGGIWSMHFVGMLAFRTSLPVTYDIGRTLASLLVAAAVSAAGLTLAAQRRPGDGRRAARRIALGGLFVGLGIVAMHYTGMAAMQMDAVVAYDPWLVAASVGIAIGAATLALWLAFRQQSTTERLGAAAVMGTAIAGMHYTAMAAARFAPCVAPTAAPPASLVLGDLGRGSGLAQGGLALAVAGTTFLILFLALLASLVDQRLARLAARESAALRASEAQFRRLYRTTPAPLHALDGEDRLRKVSDSWLELLGYAREEVIGRRLADFMTPESARRRRETDWPALCAGGTLRDVEYCFRRKDGATVDVLLSDRAERDGAGRFWPTVGALVDVTARRQAEAALRQAQKMEAVGQLTGGIAHDFNNLLTVVLGNLELAGHALDQGQIGRVRRNLATAARGAQRAAALTQRLLAFSRRQALQPQPVDMNRLVTGMSDLVHRTIGENITVATSLAEDLWPVLADPNQLESALLNLAINARDAMPDGGSLTIATENAMLDDTAAAHAELAPGPYATVAVSDTGTGMTPEVMARAFEPFFTTKDVGQGSGLGLSQVFGFVKQSGGHVALASAPGQGATVRLYFPRLAAEQAAEAPAPRPAPPVAHGETVLVCEDDPEVRAYAAEVLRGLGYALIEAGDAAAALAALAAHPQVQILLTDIGLPGPDGRHLAAEARRLRPGLRVIYATGHAPDALRAGSPGGDAPLLNKPFTVQELAERIREALEADEALV